MRSDYLDTSNPFRLIAFFKYIDCANLAATSIQTLEISSPGLRSMVVSMVEKTRQDAVREALDLLNGGEFKAASPG